jgi:hypothetical protein
MTMTPDELEVRRTIVTAFAATGEPPDIATLPGDVLAALADHHVIVLRDGRIHMAHPFAGHHDGTRVTAPDGRTWWGNCAWDGLGIVAALALHDATVDSCGITLHVRDGAVSGDARFHVLVPAAQWWHDIEHT